jgi:cytochrome P450
MASSQKDLPVTRGHMRDFVDDPVACMQRLYRAHGTVAALEEDGDRVVFVFGPEMNQRVFTDTETFHSRFFAVRGPRHSAQRRVTSGLLSMNGEEHRQHRRMVMQPFQKKTIVTYQEPIQQLARDMLDRWSPGQELDINEEMTQFMLRVTSAILFGFDAPELTERIGHQIDEWVNGNHQTGMGAIVSDPQFTSNYDRLLELGERVEQAIREMIDLRRPDAQHRNDVLSILIRERDAEGRVDDDTLIGHAALLFGAAHLTTAHSFTWALFLLAQHPTIARQLSGEIARGFDGDAPTLDDLDRLKYTERVLKESMRVLPSSSYSQRINTRPVRLGPLSLARGTAVIFSQFITHHMPELYDEPDRFLPDRWLTIAPSPYAYLPFGAGPRMCLGAPLAMLTLKTVLPMIAKRYSVAVVPGAEITGKVVSTMLGPVLPLPMVVGPPGDWREAVPVTGNIHSMVDLYEAPAAGKKRGLRAA